MHNDEKLVAVLSGSWVDAAVDFVVVPSSVDMQSVHSESGTTMEFTEWLLKNKNARYAKSGEVEVYAVGIDVNKQGKTG